MPRKDRERGEGKSLERVDRFGERMRDEALRARLELIFGYLTDVIAGGEHPVGARDHHAAGVGLRCGCPGADRARWVTPRRHLGERGRDRVKDRVVERVSLARVRDRQAHDAVRRLVYEQLAVGELAWGGAGGHQATG
jgi:hypothetical protein